MQLIWTATKAMLVFTGVTGFLYPFLVTGIGFVAFQERSGGSLLRRGSTVVGSELLAQKVEDPAYFWFRPSAADYGTVASGASNLSPASRKFLEAVEARKRVFGVSAPAELLMASASGLDPEVSREGALHQLERVAENRNLSGPQKAQLRDLIESNVKKPTFGIMGQERVNLMVLNLALDEVYSKR